MAGAIDDPHSAFADLLVQGVGPQLHHLSDLGSQAIHHAGDREGRYDACYRPGTRDESEGRPGDHRRIPGRVGEAREDRPDRGRYGAQRSDEESPPWGSGNERRAEGEREADREHAHELDPEAGGERDGCAGEEADERHPAEIEDGEHRAGPAPTAADDVAREECKRHHEVTDPPEGREPAETVIGRRGDGEGCRERPEREEDRSKHAVDDPEAVLDERELFVFDRARDRIDRRVRNGCNLARRSPRTSEGRGQRRAHVRTIRRHRGRTEARRRRPRRAGC